MERGHDASQKASEKAESYPDGYDTTYYYQQQQEGDGEGNFEQTGYDDYCSQQEGGQGSNDPYQYQYSYDASAGTYDADEGQDYYHYNTGEGYDASQQAYSTETPETWSYSPEEGQQMYWEQLTTEQTGGYYYDEQGNLMDGYGRDESPTNVFNQEAYWESGPDSSSSPYTEGPTSDPQDEEGPGSTESTHPTTESVATPELETSQEIKKKDKTARAASPSKRRKTKMERIEQRQAVLEKEEEERLKALEGGETSLTNTNAPATSKTKTVSKKKTRLVDRERAKIQLKLRIAKAIKRNRMPVQIRILPTTRKQLTPMEKYFGSKSVECVLSDIFWASMKGDFGRVKYLVEVEGDSPTDSKLDPWNLHQTPLHWAAKGGHLSCWAGHVDTSILLLRASDQKDLYVQDYDGAMSPLDWANVREHTKLLKAIEKYQDSLWLPKFVDELIRGIVRYKIKIFKDPPKKLAKVEDKETPVSADAKLDRVPTAESESLEKATPSSFTI
ncbi:hypothetical protein PInf_023575 [Phytophthora infestans]|nr:hypothetical protein PInf_023575 [Phytophthora infestans]